MFSEVMIMSWGILLQTQLLVIVVGENRIRLNVRLGNDKLTRLVSGSVLKKIDGILDP